MSRLTSLLLRRRRVFLAACIALAAGLGLSTTACRSDREQAAVADKYYCPMHPTYVSDEPGDCPICGMRLVPLHDGTATHGGHAGAPATSPGGASDLAAITVGAEGVRLAGVVTAVATAGEVAPPTRTVGLVTPDERRVRHIETRIAGWVEKLYVNTTGQLVRAGQPVMAIYSPELLASQQELLRAKQAAERFAGSSIPEVQRGGAELVEAARQRLDLFGVPPGFVAQVERSGKPQRAVTMTAPVSGFVTTKDVFEGQQVQPGVELFTLTDLSHLWVEAQFYESEASLLHLGQTAEVRLPYEPGRSLRAVVAFVYPTVSPESRTIKVRLELDNPGGLLKPGMFVDVVSGLGAAHGITVPDDAVIDTGDRQVVFVQTGPGTFTPRQVEVGVRGDGRAVILSGLAEGDAVATRANFLLDSESRLRAAIAASGHGGHER